MLRNVALSVLGLAVVSAGCASDQREWMKVDQKYTTEEFRRDYAQCTVKGGTLDDECMKARGWVPFTPPKVEQKKDDPLSQPAGRSPRR